MMYLLHVAAKELAIRPPSYYCTESILPLQHWPSRLRRKEHGIDGDAAHIGPVALLVGC